MSQPEKFEATSASITDEQKAKLKSLFPEIVTEGGKIDFDRLKLTLGESVDVGKERYGMNWPGKADCFKTIQRPSMATLVPARDESVNFDTTENLIIEGDNLETLKLLQKAYLGQVKMIYIDPPYNTGNDFIYPDDFSESLETYLRYTGQVDEEGRKFSTNTDTDGRFHSKWMNMMYPRLFLAANLLKEDGVIFISIDDNELDNLRKVCDEIFGEENFVIQFAWQSRQSIQNDTDISQNHEYVVAYAKNRRQTDRRLKESNADKWFKVKQFAAYPLPLDKNKFSNPDNDKRGPWKADPFDAPGIRENLMYPITNPKTGETFYPPEGRHWRTEKTNFDVWFADNRVVFGRTGDSRPQLKVFYEEKKAYGEVENSWLAGDRAGTATHGTKELQELFDGKAIFESPKPTSLIEIFLKIATKENDLVLDFFAGTGTTAHAVLKLNEEDKKKRRFIVVQLPELSEREDFSTISEITKERVRRVIKKFNDADKNQLALGQDEKQDRGFKVFKLQSSNFKAWNTEQPKDDVELTKQLALHVDHLVAGRTQEDVLYELLLKSGFPLDTKVEKITLAEKIVFSIADGAMLICLEKELTPEVIKAMADKKPERVVCLDAGFADNDQLKTNAVQTMKSKGVTKFQTV